MTSTEKQLIESVKKALYEESRKYSTAQERNLISIFHQALAEERERVRGLLPEEAKTAEAVELNRSEPDGSYTPPFADGLVVGWNSYRDKLLRLIKDI